MERVVVRAFVEDVAYCCSYEKKKQKKNKSDKWLIIRIPHADTRPGTDASGLVCRGAVFVPRLRFLPRVAQDLLSCSLSENRDVGAIHDVVLCDQPQGLLRLVCFRGQCTRQWTNLGQLIPRSGRRSAAPPPRPGRLRREA